MLASRIPSYSNLLHTFVKTFCVLAIFASTTLGQQTVVQLKLSDRELTPGQPPYTSDLGKPLVIILPGVLGKRIWDKNVKNGIEKSGFDGDVIIYDWTKGPLRMASNIGGCEEEIATITQRILDFKDSNPHRPLYLLGHSGGCRMVIEVLSRLSNFECVERAVLLSPCVESTYDLTAALFGARHGIVSFHSPLDIPVSLPLTAIYGITEGRLDISATTVGFKAPRTGNSLTKDIYRRKLQQRYFDAGMVSSGNLGGHFGWTAPKFVAQHVAPEFDTNR